METCPVCQGVTLPASDGGMVHSRAFQQYIGRNGNNLFEGYVDFHDDGTPVKPESTDG